MKQKKIDFDYTLILVILILSILFFAFYFFDNTCNECNDCEGFNDGSYCMPKQNKKFYLTNSSNGRYLYLDLDKKTLSLDLLNSTGFYVRGCLNDIYDTIYLRYNPNSVNFTISYSLIQVDKDMGFSKLTSLRTSKEDILFIKRINSYKSTKVRVGIRHNKKYYWFNKDESGKWLWTSDLKEADTFNVSYI